MSGLCAMLPPAAASQTGYVQLSGDGSGLGSSWVRFLVPSTSLLTVAFEIRCQPTETHGCLVVSNDENTWASVWEDGSTKDARSNTTLIDGIAVGDGNRDALHAALADGAWHGVEVQTANGTEPEGTNPFPSGSYIYYATYFHASVFSAACDARNFRMDVGRTGNWTHQSYLGDSDGFSRNNVTVVDE